MASTTRREIHYENNPNDVPHSDREKKLLSKYNKLKDRFSKYAIKKNVKVRLLKEEIHTRSVADDILKEKYPEIWKEVREENFKRCGMLEKREVRIQNMLRDWNVKKEKRPKGW